MRSEVRVKDELKTSPSRSGRMCRAVAEEHGAG